MLLTTNSSANTTSRRGIISVPVNTHNNNSFQTEALILVQQVFFPPYPNASQLEWAAPSQLCEFTPKNPSFNTISSTKNSSTALIPPPFLFSPPEKNAQRGFFNCCYFESHFFSSLAEVFCRQSGKFKDPEKVLKVCGLPTNPCL